MKASRKAKDGMAHIRIPDPLSGKLELLARRNGRSVQGEGLYAIRIYIERPIGKKV